MSSLAVSRSRADRLPAPPRPGRLRAWSYALRTANPPPGRDVRRLDAVTTWLVVTRAAVLPLTLGAGLVAGLLAVRADGFSWPLYLLALLGVLLAHVCSNLLDDLSDRDAAAPGRPVPRAAHPLASGMVRRRQVGLAVIGLWAADLVVMVVIALSRGWPVVAFAVAGAVLSLGYAAPPLRLRARGLGELAVLVVWGPLMVAGTYYAAVGSLPWQVWLASVPYGLLCTTVLLGQHLDTIERDARAGTRTLPVRLGEAGARVLTLLLLVACYAGTGLAVAVGALPWPALVVALALPLLRSVARTLRRPRPQVPPLGPERPPWFAAVLLAHGRRAGGLLVLGLALAAVVEVGVPVGGP